MAATLRLSPTTAGRSAPISRDQPKRTLSVETRPSHRSARSGVCPRTGGDGDRGRRPCGNRSTHGVALPRGRPEPRTARVPSHRSDPPPRPRPQGGEDRASLPGGAVSLRRHVARRASTARGLCPTPTASSAWRCRTTPPRSTRSGDRCRSGVYSRETSSSSAVSVTWGWRSVVGDTSTRLSRASGSRSRRLRAVPARSSAPAASRS